MSSSRLPAFRLPGIHAVVGVVMLSCLALPSVARAQRLGNLPVGARVRAAGDRATNDGIEHFHLSGRLVGGDATRIVVQRDGPDLLGPDTLPLIGVRRLDVFRGLRPRRQMIIQGAAVGGAVGVVAWLAGRQLFGTDNSVGTTDAGGHYKQGRTVVESLRVSIPLFFVGGGLVGGLVGREHWERIPNPSSVFADAR